MTTIYAFTNSPPPPPVISIQDEGGGVSITVRGPEDQAAAQIVLPHDEFLRMAVSLASSVARQGNTVRAAIPDTIGMPFGGGFYVGRHTIDGKTYALVVAPRDEGENSVVKWKTKNTSTAGARSLHDGYANSKAMNDDEHPAAQWCRGLRIGGFEDWYLPSKAELNMLCEAFMATPGGVPEQTKVEAFRDGGHEVFAGEWYWTSTEFSAYCAWMQTFGGGGQSYHGKLNSCRCRAVRKVLI